MSAYKRKPQWTVEFDKEASRRAGKPALKMRQTFFGGLKVCWNEVPFLLTFCVWLVFMGVLGVFLFGAR